MSSQKPKPRPARRNVRSRTNAPVLSAKTQPAPRIDKRANRTRGALAQAMMDLGATEGVDQVTPGKLARKAGVSRSTFYANFASKDDYLDRSFEGMFLSCERAQSAERPGDSGILPSWHFFHHVYAAKGFAMSLAKSADFPQYLAGREEFFRTRALRQIKARKAGPDAPDLAAMLAGAFTGLMCRWMETGLKTPPEELHRAFERLVRKALG